MQQKQSVTCQSWGFPAEVLQYEAPVLQRQIIVMNK